MIKINHHLHIVLIVVLVSVLNLLPGTMTVKALGSTLSIPVTVYSLYEKMTNGGRHDSGDQTAMVNNTPMADQTSSAVPTDFVTPSDTAVAPSNTVVPEPLPAPAKMITGYYAGWAAYEGYTPVNIPAAEVTNIHYAFANISNDLKIALGDPDVDITNYAELNELKRQNPRLKTSISIGGWTWSGRFSDAALTDDSRTVFADSVVAFIKQYGFDGVDIDWEYPTAGGLSSNKSRIADSANFTLMMAKIREKLDIQGEADGKHYLLSFAGAAGTYAAKLDLSVLANYVDYATIMTYDMHGYGNKYTDFNAPLYTPAEKSPQSQWSADEAVKLWKSNGFPASKIIMGVPFYGHKYSKVKKASEGLHQVYKGCKTVTYSQIVNQYLSDSDYKLKYHAEGKVPWIFNGSTMISFDDPQSIAAKAAYIQINDLAGAAIWELSQDYHDELLNTLYNGLKD